MHSLTFAHAITLVIFASGCKRLVLESDILGQHFFNALPVSDMPENWTGRMAYISEDEVKWFLYHTLANPEEEGVGRWIVNDRLGIVNSGFAFIDSWAVTPYLVHAMRESDNGVWQTLTEGAWDLDASLVVGCAPTNAEEEEGPDNTVFLDVTGWSWDLSGFYVRTGDDRTLYTHISLPGGHRSFLYKVDDNWIISEVPYDAHGMAFVQDDAELPTMIQQTEWYYAHDYEWVPFPTYTVHGTSELNIYASLFLHRRIDYLPNEQGFFELRNQIIMPSLGLGTGGIRPDRAGLMIANALREGYRHLDLAREYDNEQIVGNVFNERAQEDKIPFRHEVFLTSKVWPTHLGFGETLKEIVHSLRALDTSYIDMFMIHWPICDPDVEWMHCEETVDEFGSWPQSWMALERAYAEGFISAMGVSNFDTDLLNMLVSHGLHKPHAVQSYADLEDVDITIRRWCSENDVVFVPYASRRHIDHLNPQTASALNIIAERTSNMEHLVENVKKIYDFTLTDEELAALGWEYGVGTHGGEL